MTIRGYLFALVALCATSQVYAQVLFTELDIHTNTAGPSGLYACDLDDDDDMDVLCAANEGNFICWFRNEGGDPIEWTRFTIAANMTGAHSVHANDFDNDGDLDVVGTTYGSSIYWFRNDGGDPIEWTSFTITNSFSQAHEVYSADIDDDGDFDVMGASSGRDRITLWYNEGGDPVEWTEQIIDDSCDMAKSVSAADIDGDGLMDIVSAAIESNDVYWYRNDGSDPINWTPYEVDLNFGGAHHVYPVDLDRDGHMDIVGAAYIYNQVAWWRNSGDDPPVWTRQIIAYGARDACQAKVADLNGDSLLDVVATLQGINTISLFINDGQSPITWGRENLTTNFVRPWPLDIADFDDDGDLDVVSASSYDGSNRVTWWRNDGVESTVSDESLLASDFQLTAYPNPFNPSVTTTFTLESDSHVNLSVYNIHGQLVRVLLDDRIGPGVHAVQWDGMDQTYSPVSSGVYFLRLQSANNSFLIKVVKLQ